MDTILWDSLPEYWKICFQEAWESYLHESVPIGAVVIDNHGKIVGKGRNRVNEKHAPNGLICWNKLAHAELNCLLQVSFHEHEHIRMYSLYTTTEPCPLCFGALVMSNVRNLKYAARDRYAGCTDIYGLNSYIKSKPIKILGHDPALEVISIALNVEYAIRNWPFADKVIEAWGIDCLYGVQIGEKWHRNGRLQTARKRGEPISVIINDINETI
jgi:tRNA(adenine34) deaminase